MDGTQPGCAQRLTGMHGVGATGLVQGTNGCMTAVCRSGGPWRGAGGAPWSALPCPHTSIIGQQGCAVGEALGTRGGHGLGSGSPAAARLQRWALQTVTLVAKRPVQVPWPRPVPSPWRLPRCPCRLIVPAVRHQAVGAPGDVPVYGTTAGYFALPTRNTVPVHNTPPPKLESPATRGSGSPHQLRTHAHRLFS